MPKFIVRFQPGADLAVTVDDAANYEEAIGVAYDEMPGSICAQCSGWGQRYSLDVSFDDLEPYAVEDAAGNTVWEEKTR